jgi:hypothetical protein
MKERKNEWKKERKNERMKERKKERKNEWMNEIIEQIFWLVQLTMIGREMGDFSAIWQTITEKVKTTTIFDEQENAK